MPPTTTVPPTTTPTPPPVTTLGPTTTSTTTTTTTTTPAPINPKYYGFIDKGKPFNISWDISWSFTFALTSNDINFQHGFCTFLTTNPNLLTAIPGKSLGYLGTYPYLYSEDYQIIYSENNEAIILENNDVYNYDNSGFLAIAFDSTGYFALSSITAPGVSLSNVKKNSLIIRDMDNSLVINEHLSSLSTKFFLASAKKNYQTLRFRCTNNCKLLHIDFKGENTDFIPLTTVFIKNFNTDIITYNIPIYIGFTFCSPVSGTTIKPSTLFIKNFNYNGLSAEPTYEIESVESLYPSILTYTTISGISSL